MANMIPASGPKATDSFGERTIFSILRRDLPDDFTVIHSLPWLCAAVKQMDPRWAPTGEIDFLVVHPDLGVLALEVKSGRYRVEGSVFIHVKSNKVSDVVRQTRRNAHGLARWIGQTPEVRIKIGYGFIFPDSDFHDALISAAMVDVSTEPPQKIFVDKGQLSDVASRVIEIMRYWKTTHRNSSLGSATAQKLIEILCPHFDGTPSWATRVEYDNHLWLRLTPEQGEIVEAACNRQRMVVTGWPGTGKTLIGMEVARQNSASGSRVLVVTFNSRLADHLKEQSESNDGRCAISTWHALCSGARRKLGRPSELTQEWFRNECRQDLQLALDRGLMETYDTLVLDEAQALRPEWCDTLFGWFNGKKILAFCDETQVFSFEAESIRIDELCAKLGVPGPFFLTVVLRMPKAVTDRLLSVKSSSYQLSSPRMGEPDTVQEILVTDQVVALKDVVEQLLTRGLDASDVIVLTSYGPSPRLADLANALGLRLETVARFRGLESPAVIVCGAECMEDVELFCAYSRATTVCIALYTLEELGWRVVGDFHKTLLAFGNNAALAQEARFNSQTTNLIVAQKDLQRISIQTANLSWSPSWKAWLIELKDTDDTAETWIDYLVSHHSWPVFLWYENSRQQIWRTSPESDLRGEVWYSGMLLGHCETCNELLPYQIVVDYECLNCQGKMDRHVSPPTQELYQQLEAYDHLIRGARVHGTSKNDVEMQDLPLPLAATGARFYAFARKKRDRVVHEGLPTGKLLYRSALAFVQSRIAFLPADQHLVLDDIASELHARYKAVQLVGLTDWRNTLATAFATCYRKGLITKIEKGRYAIVDD